MIHIFNRAELLLTQDLEMVNRIRDMLQAHGIAYHVAVKNTFAASTVRNGRAGNIPGIPGNNPSMYTVFVRRKDLTYAEHLINK